MSECDKVILPASSLISCFWLIVYILKLFHILDQFLNLSSLPVYIWSHSVVCWCDFRRKAVLVPDDVNVITGDCDFKNGELFSSDQRYSHQLNPDPVNRIQFRHHQRSQWATSSGFDLWCMILIIDYKIHLQWLQQIAPVLSDHFLQVGKGIDQILLIPVPLSIQCIGPVLYQVLVGFSVWKKFALTQPTQNRINNK